MIAWAGSSSAAVAKMAACDSSPVSAILPINAENLLRGSGVESERVAFKVSWGQHATGPQVLRTICAFANA